MLDKQFARIFVYAFKLLRMRGLYFTRVFADKINVFYDVSSYRGLVRLGITQYDLVAKVKNIFSQRTVKCAFTIAN